MSMVRQFVAIVWNESRKIFTGSVIALVLSFLGYAGVPIPSLLVVYAALAGSFWATFRAWQSERLHRSQAEKDLAALEARQIGAAPVVLATYVDPGLKKAEERLIIRNSSLAPAFNVRVQPVVWKDVTISFRPLPQLLPGEEATLEATFDRPESPFLNRVHDVLMIGFDRIPAGELRGWAEPRIFMLAVAYTDAAGQSFGTTSEIAFHWQTSDAELKHFSGVTRARSTPGG